MSNLAQAFAAGGCFTQCPLSCPVFGVDLTTLVMMEGSTVPFFLQQCLMEVERRDMSTEGMYRVSGQARSVTHLKEDVDEGTRRTDILYGIVLDVCWANWISQSNVPLLFLCVGEAVHFSSYDDVHTLTGAVKLFLRELPIPLISFSAYEPVMEQIPG